MRDLQPCLDAAVSGLNRQAFDMSDIIGAYMRTARMPLCGTSLEQALGKHTGEVTVMSIGSVDDPAADAVRIFDAVVVEHRKIFLLAVVSLCYFSERARTRFHSLATAYDAELSKDSEQ